MPAPPESFTGLRYQYSGTAAFALVGICHGSESALEYSRTTRDRESTIVNRTSAESFREYVIPAPSGGFSPIGSLGGTGVSSFAVYRARRAGGGPDKRAAGDGMLPSPRRRWVMWLGQQDTR